jgi:hypothetical protein
VCEASAGSASRTSSFKRSFFLEANAAALAAMETPGFGLLPLSLGSGFFDFLRALSTTLAHCSRVFSYLCAPLPPACSMSALIFGQEVRSTYCLLSRKTNGCARRLVGGCFTEARFLVMVVFDYCQISSLTEDAQDVRITDLFASCCFRCFRGWCVKTMEGIFAA